MKIKQNGGFVVWMLMCKEREDKDSLGTSGLRIDGYTDKEQRAR